MKKWCQSILWAAILIESTYFAATSIAEPINSVCATKSVRLNTRAMANFEKKLQGQRMSTSKSAAVSTITIPVYFHVIQKDETVGAVSLDRLALQIDVLNQGFSGAQGGAASPFRFVNAGVDVTVNPIWYAMKPDSEEELQAKRALKFGGAKVLNIYTVTPSFTLGWASPLWFVYASTGKWPTVDDLTRDGVVLAHNTIPVPGATPLGFNQGDTAVHEVGHWLGLYHTYEGGCSSRGDRVSDTPSEMFPSIFCNPQRDTCPSVAGFDPVENFMDYTDDVCRTGFTTGQIARMLLTTYLTRGR